MREKERKFMAVCRIAEAAVCVFIVTLFVLFADIMHAGKAERISQTVEVKETENLISAIRSYVPDYIEEYAEENYTRFVAEGEEVSLGTPYRIYAYPVIEHKSAVYQYPLYREGKVVDTFCVLYDGTSQICMGSMKGSAVAGWLEEVDYAGNNYMLYSIKLNNGLELLVAEDALGNKLYEDEEIFSMMTDSERTLLDDEPYDKAMDILTKYTEG